MISPVRRTSIVVGDMDRSMNFYRDLFGMKVFYDQVIEAEASAKLLGVPTCRVRIASLQEDDSINGMVGLLQFLSPEINPRSIVREGLTQPDAMLLFMADDIDIAATHQRLSDNGVEIICPPLEYDLPERGAVSGFSCQDPDGVLVAVMRFGGLDAPGGKVKASPTRRTTIIVDDLEASLVFYRDVLGMNVFYDQVLSSQEEGQMLGVPDARIRIVSLQAQGATDGMVGLMEFQSPVIKPRQHILDRLEHPDLCLIFTTEKMAELFAGLEKNGAHIKCPPLEYDIPGRGRCAGFTCYDPNGVVIEFTQFGPL